jgi:hypothetical protein
MLDLPVNIELLLYRMQDNTYTLYKVGIISHGSQISEAAQGLRTERQARDLL